MLKSKLSSDVSTKSFFSGFSGSPSLSSTTLPRLPLPAASLESSFLSVPGSETLVDSIDESALHMPGAWKTETSSTSRNPGESGKAANIWKSAGSKLTSAFASAWDHATFGTSASQRAVTTGVMAGSQLMVALPQLLTDPKAGFAQLGVRLSMILGTYSLGLYSRDLDASLKNNLIGKTQISEAHVMRGLLQIARLTTMPAQEAAAFTVSAMASLVGQNVGTLAGVQSALSSLEKTRTKRAIKSLLLAAPLIALTEGARGMAGYAALAASRNIQMASTRASIESAFSARALLNSSRVCNGLEAICDKPWDEVTFLGTHNSFIHSMPFNFDGAKSILNPIGRLANIQPSSIEQQFADGVRAFSLEYFIPDYSDPYGSARLSHNTYWDSLSLQEGVDRIYALVNKNPNDLIIVKLSPQRSGELSSTKVFDRYARDYKNVRGQKVSSLLTRGVKIITVDDDFPQSNFEATSLKDINCNNMAGGSESFWLNAFTTYPHPFTSAVTNSFLQPLLEDCLEVNKARGGAINVISVNDHQTADILPFIDQLNMQSRS